MKRSFFILFISLFSLFSTLHANENFTNKKKDWQVVEFPQDMKDRDCKDIVCRFYICSHGTTDFIKEGRLQGWSQEAKLSPEGVQEVQAIGEKLYHLGISHIYSSDLTRSIESARVLLDAIDVAQATRTAELVSDAAFREANHTEFQGQLKTSYQDHPHLAYYSSLSLEERVFCPFGPQGESVVDILERALPKIKEISQTHRGSEVILVTHGGLLKGLRILSENDFSYIKEHEIGRSEVLCLDVYVDREGNLSFLFQGIK